MMRFVCAVALLSMTALSATAADCGALPDHAKLQQALRASTKASGGPSNGGFDLHTWASVVARDGTVCAVAFSGQQWDEQWPGSRVIAVQKAGAANAFSLKGLAVSTANLFSAVQPGGSLFGLQESNPVNAAVAYDGAAADFGSPQDPLVGKRLGGINVFGGGLALYDKGNIVGGLGVSGDSSCADHNIAWRVRHALGLGTVPSGVSKNKDDGIIYDIAGGRSRSGFGHPKCGGREDKTAKELKAAG